MSEKFFFYRDGYELIRLNINEVLILKAKKNYVYFVTASKVFIIRTTLETAVEQLSSQHFVKVNRTIAVCLRLVTGINRESLFLRCPGVILPLLKKLDVFGEPDENTPVEMLVNLDEEIEKAAKGEASKIKEDCIIEFTIYKSYYSSIIQKIIIIGNMDKEKSSGSGNAASTDNEKKEDLSQKEKAPL